MLIIEPLATEPHIPFKKNMNDGNGLNSSIVLRLKFSLPPSAPSISPQSIWLPRYFWRFFNTTHLCITLLVGQKRSRNHSCRLKHVTFVLLDSFHPQDRYALTVTIATSILNTPFQLPTLIVTSMKQKAVSSACAAYINAWLMVGYRSANPNLRRSSRHHK